MSVRNKEVKRLAHSSICVLQSGAIALTGPLTGPLTCTGPLTGPIACPGPLTGFLTGPLATASPGPA
ncbi:unnamed protein product [Gadus morhua 'NCC']